MHHLADQAAHVWRLSLDAQASVQVGPCARGGKRRVRVEAADHDVQPAATGTPGGIWLPTLEEWCVYGIPSTVTSACLGERIAPWGETVRERFAPIPPLVIQLENGPANHRRRTQCMPRRGALVRQYQGRVRFAYYPPYPRKYQPSERGWGLLETHWQGALLDAIEAVLACTRPRTGHGGHPVVALVTTT